MPDAEHDGLVEYLPGQWMTPAAARAQFCGGPILPADEALDLAIRLFKLAETLLQQIAAEPPS